MELWKHENNQHALVPPKTEHDVAAQVAEELKTVTYVRYPSYGGTQKENNAKVVLYKKKNNLRDQVTLFDWTVKDWIAHRRLGLHWMSVLLSFCWIKIIKPR